jgi:thiol-disulfide isomerase/thioredoxin
MKRYFIILFLLFICTSCGGASSLEEESTSSLEEETPSLFTTSAYLLDDKQVVLFYSPYCMACKSALETLSYRQEKQYFPLITIDVIENQYPVQEELVSNLGVKDLNLVKIYRVPYLVYYQEEIVKEVRGFDNIQKENVYTFFD